MVEAVAIAVLVFAPLLAFLVHLFKATRNLTPQRPIEAPAWKPRGTEQPPRGADPDGDREPRRPLIPSGSAAVSSPLVPDDVWDEDQAAFRPVDRCHGGSEPGHRLAGCRHGRSALWVAGGTLRSTRAPAMADHS